MTSKDVAATVLTIPFYHELQDERLRLKDKWIEDRFEARDRAIAEAKQALEKEVADLTLLLSQMIKAEHEWTTLRFEQGSKRFDDYMQASRERIEAHNIAHSALHEINEKNHEDFKDVVQQRIEALTKALEVLRDERGLFVLRDSYEAKVDAVEKQSLTLEKTMTEKFETSLAQIKSGLEARIETNADRIGKQEQNLQVTNARNQQSIIALGILLTLVELIIRFYN